MKSLVVTFFLLFSTLSQASVYFEVNWNANLRKELIVSCDSGSNFCQNLCGNANQCVRPEGACRDCIGTSLMMTNIIGEMGRTLVNSGKASVETEFLNMLLSNEFATLGPNDVYNVIDASGSIRAMKKFEQLCPEGSLDQLVFLQVDPYTRKIQAPKAVYCMLEEGSLIFDLSSRPDVIINERFLFIPQVL